MQTDDLIDGLASNLAPVPRHALRTRFLVNLVPALCLSLVLMVTVLGFRFDMPNALMLPEFWIKSAYNAALAVLGFVALYRMARPDGSDGGYFTAAGTVFAIMGLIAATQIWIEPSDQYSKLVMGSSALDCPFLIFGFSLPILIAAIRVLRRSAPTDLRRTGLVTGLAAGAAGAWVYSWFCDENGMAFVLIWYTLSIVLLGALGALIGPRLLRW
ncbi:NrsF family protein [Rhizobium halophytocola]|uniref:DUF1109 family protein n=1 Tax=Rhizobium halophytocola TaxID=735519 RepID=A0ABS4DWU9_9HYPH|nr:DUF1109 domain-containing protein [Rhizobium halophytocola]MBP1850145.1 hypothetical protein [Rhizobium halophytocola]